MEIFHILVVFLVGIVASSLGTLVGGTGLITIPTLIFLGLPPHIAIGTNRFGLTGLNMAGWYKFHEKRMINYKIGFAILIPTLLGAIMGANLVLHINEIILRKLIATVNLIVLFFIILKPKIGIERPKYAIGNREYTVGTILSFFVGIYCGSYGAGNGILLSYILILLFGQTFLESAATRKMATLFSSVMAATIFAVSGVITYSLAIALFLGTFVGSYFGAHYSDRIGNLWIRRLFFVVVFVMAIKLVH